LALAVIISLYGFGPLLGSTGGAGALSAESDAGVDFFLFCAVIEEAATSSKQAKAKRLMCMPMIFDLGMKLLIT
jgi:hypothetical protein